MPRASVLDEYRAVRAGIQRVLGAASEACPRADLKRASRQVVPWAEEADLTRAGVGEMVMDVALFEPNARGTRAFDRLRTTRLRLPPEDAALAERMAGAWFSLFRVAGKHPSGGLWLEDLLAGDRRVRLMDEAASRQLVRDNIVAGRLFDAGRFHAAFGLLVRPRQDRLSALLVAVQRGVEIVARPSLAAVLYADSFLPPLSEEEELLAAARLMEAFLPPR